MIGRHYDYEHYNCAHFVAEWYAEKLGVIIPVTGVFELSFVRWMRKHFVEIDKPEENCLVLMNSLKTSHVGVFSAAGVYHNWKPAQGRGSVVHTPIGQIKRNFEKVSYWKWSQ